MSLVPHQAAFLLDACKLIQYATEQGWVVTGGELHRTIEQQQIHVRAGRSMTMNSPHLNRLAIDLFFFRNGQLVWDRDAIAQLGQYWESLDPKNRWGGNFRRLVDVPHFERMT
jgi:hypothetical protein